MAVALIDWDTFLIPDELSIGLAAAGLLAHTPRPSEAQIVDALEGNLCRCTGYVNIVAAVRQAADQMAVGARA